jgi:hypothetical protein
MVKRRVKGKTNNTWAIIDEKSEQVDVFVGKRGKPEHAHIALNDGKIAFERGAKEFGAKSISTIYINKDGKKVLLRKKWE